MRRRAAQVATASLGLVAALLIGELAFRLHPAPNTYYMWEPNRQATFQIAPGVMHGVNHPARFLINSHGVRGPEWSSNRSREYRILAIGGSTTECLYLDQTIAWPAQLQDLLGATSDGRSIWVGNVGRSGRNARDHLAFMTRALDQYDVDEVVILVGVNDMAARLVERDAYDPDFMQADQRTTEWLRSRFAIVPWYHGIAYQPWYARSAIYQVVNDRYRPHLQDRNANAVFDLQDEGGLWYTGVRRLRQQATLSDDLPDLTSALDEYARNIETIVSEARRRNVKITLMTQPSIWYKNMTPEEQATLWLVSAQGPFTAAYLSPDALATTMDQYNRRLLDTCTRLRATCLDLASALPKSLDTFYDDVHFNEQGSTRVAELLAADLRSRLP